MNRTYHFELHLTMPDNKRLVSCVDVPAETAKNAKFGQVDVCDDFSVRFLVGGVDRDEYAEINRCRKIFSKEVVNSLSDSIVEYLMNNDTVNGLKKEHANEQSL